MRIGINGSSLIALNRPVSEIVDHAVEAERDGFASYWVAQLEVPRRAHGARCGGTGDVVHRAGHGGDRHLAAPPVDAGRPGLDRVDMSGGRLALGIGLAPQGGDRGAAAHPVRPSGPAHGGGTSAVLLPAMRDRSVDATGEIWSAFVEATGGPPEVAAPSVLLAAMGPRMLRLAGGRPTGTSCG
jgi:alkanesulfonate monooxygenase SsuD/methylene tetrahydromethanopterin reductase-like flavin-dependent oxidoreductase (luciferase family)